MDNRINLDPGFLLPLGIGVFSVFGIGLLLLLGSLNPRTSATPLVATATLFTYRFLGEPTSVSDPDLELTVPAEQTFPGDSADPFFIATAPDDEFSTSIPQDSQSTTATVNRPANLTPTPAAVLQIIDTYEDTDSRLQYDGDWTAETDVPEASEETLFVSSAVGSDVTFFFTGQQLIIGYLSEPGFGSLAVSIDDMEFQIDQSTDDTEWVSPLFENGEHFVIIIHESGDLANLDYINVLATE